MPKRPLPLDYSSPAREGQEERERREALDNYNQSTFGERRPVAASLLRLAVTLIVLTPLVMTVSRRTASLLTLLGCAAYLVWEWRATH